MVETVDAEGLSLYMWIVKN